MPKTSKPRKPAVRSSALLGELKAALREARKRKSDAANAMDYSTAYKAWDDEKALTRALAIMRGRSPSIKRVKKAWWAVVEGGRVVHVEGYSCAPENRKYWWCPAVGLSLSEDHHLFEREKDALRAAVAEAEREAVAIQRQVKQLKARLANETRSATASVSENTLPTRAPETNQ